MPATNPSVQFKLSVAQHDLLMAQAVGDESPGLVAKRLVLAVLQSEAPDRASGLEGARLTQGRTKRGVTDGKPVKKGPASKMAAKGKDWTPPVIPAYQEPHDDTPPIGAPWDQ